MYADLIESIQDTGFELIPNGGNTEVLIYRRNGCSIVASGIDGDLPSWGWFMICVYAGDWSKNVEAPILLCLTSEECGGTECGMGLALEQAHSLIDSHILN